MNRNIMLQIGFLCLLVFLLAGLLVFGCNEDSDDDDDNNNDSATCNSTCWQYSPEQATGSMDQADQWAAQCEEADPGCPENTCVAIYMEFYNSPDNLRYSVQCETTLADDRYDQCFGNEPVAAYYGLGDDYGFLDEKNCTQCGSDWTVPTGWASMPFPESIEDAPLWNEDKIADVLAHEISDVPCEQIEDYHQCVRAFIPPNTHCISYGEGEPCFATQEPYNRYFGWLDDYKEQCPSFIDK